eukprot:TRINITY_DN12712_c0_g1_i2.p1 TRINITY_DN12712_c0_g1~~TRINITY_DN12712_c0_g1_i2.p1  ORF type:complete len:189 (-),score=41.17 TRINITY_DN12712_c0_g1_i2:158-724(-)
MTQSMPNLHAQDNCILKRTAEPNYSDVFYKSSASCHAGTWQDGTPGMQVGGDLPSISEILASRARTRKPVRPLVTTAKCMLANAMEEERKTHQGDKVLSADICPKKFPVEAKNISYPEEAKRGGTNPLYRTSSQVYGSEKPQAHQVSDRYFPSGNKFTKSFVDTKPRFTGLSTQPTRSRAHKALDLPY